MSARLQIAGQLVRDGFSVELSIDVDLSESLGVLGPTGAGKTTLLRIIAGLEPDFRGRVEVTLDGHRQIWAELDRGDLVPVHRRGVGVVFQDSRLLPGRTVRANLDYAMQRARAVSSGHEMDHMVRALAIEPLLAQQVAVLSGGERQRVAIARTLLSQPRLLLMDEPLAANDNAHRQAVIAFLLEWREKHRTPLIYVSHSVRELIRVAPRCLAMQHGQVIAEGKAAEIARSGVKDSEAGVAGVEEGRRTATVVSADAETGIVTLQVQPEYIDSLEQLSVGDQLVFETDYSAFGLGAPLQPEPGEDERESD
ncbi:MAG: ATP-binding cassette domain-containing protein [Halieaceae bacterium]